MQGTLKIMPSHLGKIYVNELVFTGAYDAVIASTITQSPDDLTKLAASVTVAFETMRVMHSTMLKTLIDTSKGIILITTKA